MNKKYLKNSLLMMFLVVYMPSYTMHGTIFKLARFVGVTTAPAFGLYTACNKYKGNQEEVEALKPVTEDAVKNWFIEEKQKLNISNVKLIEGKNWTSYNDGKTGYVEIPSDDITKLNEALINKSVNNKTTMLKDNSEIARDVMFLKHEFAHIINKDSQYRTCSVVAIPLAIEALSFGAISAVRKLCNIQEPKTLTKTILRSSVAIGSIVPKGLLSLASVLFLWRSHETRCDKFACEHAESRLELEEFAKWHKNNESLYATGSRNDIRFAEFEKDPTHPAPVDRREMVETYIAQWDTTHAQLQTKA
jgi:hypothetical protein